jgi:hypothetical protein
VSFAPRSSSFWRQLRCPLKPGKRRVNLIPVGFTPMPAATALFLIVLIGVVIGGYIASSASACATVAVTHEPRC